MTTEAEGVTPATLHQDTYVRAIRAHERMTCLLPGCAFCTNVIKDEIDAAVANERSLHDELVEALRPFANLATSNTVMTAALRGSLLTLSNGERMSGISADAFIKAAEVAARAALAKGKA